MHKYILKRRCRIGKLIVLDVQGISSVGNWKSKKRIVVRERARNRRELIVLVQKAVIHS